MDLATAFAAATAFDTSELARRTAYRRAVEATIWAMPAVSMAALRASLRRDLDADFGDIVYFSKGMEPRHEFLTADARAPWVLTCFDLGRGPMVLEVPPASETTVFRGSAIDSWEVPLVDVGGTGEDAGKGGRYLFLPPGHGGETPAGWFVVPSPTCFVHVALRPVGTGEGTPDDDPVAYSRSLKAYPLAEAARPPANRYIDAYPHAWNTLPAFDLGYLHLLAGVIDADPPQAKDAVMLAMLASIGIEKGRPFEPDGDRAALLTQAVQEGEAFMNDALVNHALECYWPGRRWLGGRRGSTFGFSFHGGGRLDYDRRAGAFAYWARWAPKGTGEPGRLPASCSLHVFRERDGELFRGDTLYRLRVPADTPARDAWSITAYEVGTNAFIHTPENRVGVSSRDRGRMRVNGDGSVDVYIGPRPPEGLASHWIPTAGRDFWLVARFHGPQPPLFDRTWVMPDVERAA
jgi:hypothetical protein